MAEEVQISNVGGEGVASEVTLARLVAVTEQMAKSAGIDPKGVNKKLKELAESSGDLIDIVDDNTKALNKNKKAVDKSTEAANKFAKSLIGIGSSLAGTVTTSIVGFKNALFSGSEQLADFTQHIPVFGSVLTPLVALIDENVDSFRELSNIGAQFGDGLNDIRRNAVNASIPLSEFTDLVSQNAQRMQMFGGTVAQGATTFAKMSKELRDGPGRRFIQMGYTATELNQALIDYAEFTGTQMNADRRMNRMSVQGAAEYLEVIDELARVSGKRRDQIREEINAATADTRSRMAMSQMSTTQAANFAAGLSEVETIAPALKEALIDLSDGVANTPFTATLESFSQTFRNQGRDLENMDAGERNRFFVAVREEMDAYTQSLGQVAVDGIIATGGVMAEVVQVGSSLRTVVEKTQEELAADAEAAARQATADAGILDFGTTLRDIRSNFMSILTGADLTEKERKNTETILQKVTKGLNTLAEKLADFVQSPAFTSGIQLVEDGLLSLIDVFEKFITDIQTFDLKTALFGGTTDIQTPGGTETISTQGLFGNLDLKSKFNDVIGDIGTSIVTGLKEMLTSEAVLTGAVVAIGGLFAASTVSSALSGGISRLFGAGTGPSRAGVGRSPGRAGGQAGAAVGNFVGQMGGGVMRGAAGGLTAFANPAVLLGATNLSLAIIAIGGAVAGATWMVGASLPTFATGMKSFEDIDGDKLVNAGKGMAAVAGGMAAFGAGSAVSGLGNLVGSVTQGLVSLFGGDTPFDKLEEFGEFNFNRERIENNAAAMMAFGQAMAVQGAGAGLSGIGNLVNAIGDFIGGLFGGDSPIEQVKEFGDMQINAAGVTANAEAMASMSRALSTMSGLDLGDVDIPNRLVNRLMSLGQIPGGGLTSVAEGMTAIANVSGLQNNLDILNSGLDIDGVRNYTNAMEDLVEVLGDLNDELSKDNKFGPGTGTNAGDVVSTINTGTGSNSEQLNNTMQQVLAVLSEIRGFGESTANNTRNIVGSNLARGNVSTIG